MTSMTGNSKTFSYAIPQPGYRKTCPVCNGPVYRVRRRFIDRLIGLLIPLRRYRCSEPHCRREGNLRKLPANLLLDYPPRLNDRA